MSSLERCALFRVSFSEIPLYVKRSMASPALGLSYILVHCIYLFISKLILHTVHDGMMLAGVHHSNKFSNLSHLRAASPPKLEIFVSCSPL